VEDPLRKAFAFVTLIGRGPLPPPVPRLEIAPKQISLYYPEDYDNAYIDSSNTRQLFRAFLRDSPPQPVEWLLDGVVQATGPDPWYLYTVTGSGDVLMRTIKVRLQSDHAIADDAKVIQINYSWPGLL
jgi:hypothetical protein